MKISKRIVLLFLLLGTLFLTACGIEVSTDMNLENEFQGTRTISCFVSKQDMAAYFRGETANIDELIKENCPDCFSYRKEDSSAGTTYIFELAFESLEHYKELTESVLNFSPEITFEYSDSLFSSRIVLNENFTSADLLCWFEILLKEEYSIKENQLNNLWDMKDTVISWNDKIYKISSDKINLSELEQIPFDGIEIYTTETDTRVFERQIKFKIPTTTLDNEVLNLQKAFKDITPEHTSGKWVGTKTGKNYEITFEAEDFPSLSAITNQILSGKEADASSSSTFDEYLFFQFHFEHKENLIFSRFLSTEDGKVPVSYYYKPNSMMETGATGDNGYFLIQEGNFSSLETGYTGTMTIPVESYEITSTFLGNGNLEREIIFYFPNLFTEDEKSDRLSFFSKNPVSDAKVTLSEEGNTGKLTITQSGDIESMNDSSHLLFGTEGNMVAYTKHSNILSAYQDTTLEESIDLSRFLGDANKQTPGIYHFLQKSDETLLKFSMSSDFCDISFQDTTDKNSYTASVDGCSFTTHYEGNVQSFLGMTILLTLVIVVIIFLWLLIKRNPLPTRTK